MGFSIQYYRVLILLYRSSRVIFIDLLISSLQDTSENICLSSCHCKYEFGKSWSGRLGLSWSAAATATLPSWRKDWKHKSGIYPLSSCVGVYLNPFIKSDTSDQVCLINIKFLYSESWLNHFNFNIKHLSPSAWGLRKY